MIVPIESVEGKGDKLKRLLQKGQSGRGQAEIARRFISLTERAPADVAAEEPLEFYGVR